MKNLSEFLKKIRKEDTASWKIIYDRFKPAQEGLREALCTLGNGYLGVRGAACESVASRIHYPGTYIAGVYNKLETDIAGRTILNEDLVNCPNWLFLTFRIGKGEWVTPETSKVLSYYQELGMRRGVLSKRVRLRDSNGQITTVETQRIVHMSDPHRATIKYTIIPENYEGWIVIGSVLDGAVQNTGVARYKQLNSKHLRAYSTGTFGKNGVYLSVKTNQSGIEISEAAKVHIFTKGKEIKPTSRILKEEKKGICQELGIFVRKNQRYEIEKIVSVYTSRDKGIRSPVNTAINSVKNSHGFESLFKSHRSAWDVLWKRFDVQIEGDSFSQKVLRLHTFHLLQSASVHNTMIDAGLPARGLHGEAYRGHVFWDELFVMPFFNLHIPQVAKALLLYRYRRIHQARKYAKENGYKGAMFPWQSSSTGEEETQVIHLNPMSGKWGPDYSRIQRHISFAVAYNLWQYWKSTSDLDFLTHYGAEMLLSIAQFGASMSKYNSKDGRYHTEGIMGPDEFHEKLPGKTKAGFKDNAYTNLLIVWTLLKAQEAISTLPKHHKIKILQKLNLDQKELARWKDITRKMNIIFNDEGIISQFDGYFGLKELDWQAYRLKYGKIQRMDRILKSEGKSPNSYKVAKQADVLMIFYLFRLSEIKSLFSRLGYRFDRNMLKKNYEYYVKRTSHGSTLSKVVHCYVSHLLGKSRESWQWFLEVLKSDIHDTQGGTTPEGIHAGVMGGSINIIMQGFAGINILDNYIKIDPHLPKNWRSIKLRFRYKRNWIAVSVLKDQVRILIHGPKLKTSSVPIKIYGKLYHFLFGKTYEVSSKKGAYIIK